ncbi:MAG: acyltransferase [Candidatus Obscuribacterales bacterium]|nr:acyltransferase [Candidatus Obscuribacterales bacterium]
MHRQQLDGLRFLAFLLVFAQHFIGIQLTGAVGVNLFFVLSGFLITRLLLKGETGSIKHDLKVFYIRRSLRIFPLYYFVLLVLLAIGLLPYPLWLFTYLWNIKIYLLGQSTSLVNHFWSLCVEEQFYLSYAPLILLVPSIMRLRFLTTMILLTIIAKLIFQAVNPNTLYELLLPVRGQYLFWGCLAGLLELQANTKNWSGSRCFMLGLALILAWIPLELNQQHLYGLDETVCAFAMALVVFGLWRTNNAFLLNTFSFRPIAYLGKISYGLYVFHMFSMPIGIFLLILVPSLAFITKPVLYFAITVGMASLSWYYLENPINRLKNRFPYGQA